MDKANNYTRENIIQYTFLWMMRLLLLLLLLLLTEIENTYIRYGLILGFCGTLLSVMIKEMMSSTSKSCSFFFSFLLFSSCFSSAFTARTT
jgi:hypothetical protein